MKKRKYSDREKAAALAFLQFNGKSIHRCAELLEIPRRTLEHWARGENKHPEVANLAQEKKEEIFELIEKAVREMVGASAGKLTSANFQQLWTGVGIAVDKMQLLKGEPTAINKNLTDEERAKRAAEILERGKLRLAS